MKNYRELKQLKNYNSVCLIGHLSPDIDAISSMIVFKDFLVEKFNIKTVDIFADATSLSTNICDLLNGEKINQEVKIYDAAIMMDSPNILRLGKYQKLFNDAKLKVVIDHHITNNNEGNINIVEQQSSTCEIVYNIAKYFKYNLSIKNQSNIYAGIITDTNNFTVGNFNKKTFMVIEEIIDNIDHESIYNKFLLINSLKTMQLLSFAIKNIETFKDDAIIISHITNEEASSLNATSEDFVGIINKLATIENNKLTCLIYPNNQQYYVSMRAKKGYKISGIAKQYGGGGHDGAAAFLSNELIKNIKEIIHNEFLKII